MTAVQPSLAALPMVSSDEAKCFMLSRWKESRDMWISRIDSLGGADPETKGMTPSCRSHHAEQFKTILNLLMSRVVLKGLLGDSVTIWWRRSGG